MIEYLAQTDGWLSPGGIATILGAFGLFLGGLGVGRGTKLTKLAPGSELTLKDEYMPRREAEQRFERLESVVTVNATKMESYFERAVDKMTEQAEAMQKRMENRDIRLTKKIEEVASAGYQGRQKIWVKVNNDAQEMGERLAKIETNQEVAAQLGKLAEAIKPTPTKVQPTHSNA